MTQPQHGNLPTTEREGNVNLSHKLSLCLVLYQGTTSVVPTARRTS